jgi:WD40 repeat protein
MTAADPTKTHASKDLAHNAPLIACRFDLKGPYVYGSSEDRSIQRWDLGSGNKVALTAHDSWVHALASSPDGQTFLSGGCDGRLIWWPVASEKPSPIRVVEAHRGWVRDVAVSRDGTLAASCGNDRMARIWSLADGALVQELPGHAKHIYRLAFDPTGKFLITADLQGLVIQWELATRKEVRRLDAAKLHNYNQAGQFVDYGGIRDVAFSRDGAYLACSGLIEASNPLGAVSNPAIVLFDWVVGKEKLLQRPKEDAKGVGWGLRFHPDGFLVMVSGGTSGGILWFFKPDQVNEFFKFGLPNTGRDLDLHPDGLRLAVAHHDGHLRVYTMAAKAA